MSAPKTPPVPVGPDEWVLIRLGPQHPPQPDDEQAPARDRRIEFAAPLWGLRKPTPVIDGRRPATTREALEVHSYLLRAFHARPDLADRADQLLHEVLRRPLRTEHAEPPAGYLRVDRIA